MRLHFQRNPQTERQRQLPHGGKSSRRKAELQDTPSTNSFTYSRSRSLLSVPSHQRLSHHSWFTSNQKGTDQLQMARSELPEWREQPARSTLGTAEIPLLPRTSRCPKRSQNRHTPNRDPMEPRGWFSRYLIFSLVRWWCEKAENWYLQPRRICQSPVTHKRFFTCSTFREDTGVGCQQLPDSDRIKTRLFYIRWYRHTISVVLLWSCITWR